MRRPIPVDRLEGLLDEPEAGLATEGAAKRQSLHGWNDIVETPPGKWSALARDTARDPMLWFLLGTAVLFTWLGDYVEAFTLLGALVPLVGMDAYLHRRTQASTRSLAGRLATTARVLRDGTWAQLPARELVPGDLIEIDSDGSAPADGLLVAGENVQVDESMLSGESLPVRKHPLAPTAGGRPAAQSGNWIVAGTRVLTGPARVRLAYTGGETLYGEIVRLTLQGAHARTPLQQAIGRLVSVLLIVALAFCLLLAAIRLYQGHGIIDALLSAVTLAVAALPEEFPVVFTFFLGAGVYRLAKRQALVRRAVAVENIGRVTCICSDKTGTMTEGRLVLGHRDPAAGMSGDELDRVAALASRTDSGDPLDAAILALAPLSVQVGSTRLQMYPFTEARRCETSVWRLATGETLAAMKGAPETVLERSVLTEEERSAWLGRIAGHAAGGHKVIACAMRSVDAAASQQGEPDQGFRFAGLLAFGDPLRDGVREAVSACTRAGIRVIMVTGDHPGTARAIASEAGLGNGQPAVVVMDEFESALQAGGADSLAGVDVVARAVPAQKLALVRALQQQGEIVAVTGDGVNDAPALQAADVGIAMGDRGSRTAREVAAIVLLDDNFSTIVGAISEGRQLFRNLQLSFAYLLMVHLPLVLTAAIVPLSGHPLLYLPIHIVWLELIMHPTALLAFQDTPPQGHMAPLHRGTGSAFYGPWSWAVIGIVGAAVSVAMMFFHARAINAGFDPERARTVSLVVLILASVTIMACLSRLRSWMARAVAAAAIASLLLMVQVPAIAGLVHLRPLPASEWAATMAAAILTGSLSWLVAARSSRAVGQSAAPTNA